MDRRIGLAAALAGLGFAVGGTLVEMLFPAPVEPGGSPDAIIAAMASPDAFRTVTLLAASTSIGTALLVAFVAAIGRYLDPDHGTLAQLAVVGAAAAFVISLLRRGLIIAVVQSATAGQDGPAVAFYIAATDSLVRVFAMPQALWLGSVGFLALSTRRLPAWAGWSALVLGAVAIAAMFVPAIDSSADAEFPVYLLSLVWLTAVSVTLLVRWRSPQPSTADATAAAAT